MRSPTCSRCRGASIGIACTEKVPCSLLARWTRRSRPLLFCGVEYDGVDVIGSVGSGAGRLVVWLCVACGEEVSCERRDGMNRDNGRRDSGEGGDEEGYLALVAVI